MDGYLVLVEHRGERYLHPGDGTLQVPINGILQPGDGCVHEPGRILHLPEQNIQFRVVSQDCVGSLQAPLCEDRCQTLKSALLVKVGEGPRQLLQHLTVALEVALRIVEGEVQLLHRPLRFLRRRREVGHHVPEGCTCRAAFDVALREQGQRCRCIFKADAVEVGNRGGLLHCLRHPLHAGVGDRSRLGEHVPDPANLSHRQAEGVNGTSRGEGRCANPQLTHCGEVEYRRQGCEAGLYIKAGLSQRPHTLRCLNWGLKCTRCRGCERLKAYGRPVRQLGHKLQLVLQVFADVEYSLGARTNGCTGYQRYERAIGSPQATKRPSQASGCRVRLPRCVTPPLRNGRGLARGR